MKMKIGAFLVHILLIFVFAIVLASFFSIVNREEKLIRDCKYKNIYLSGRVKVVEHFPDFKVKVDNNFPDFQVKIVNHTSKNCGEWMFVDDFPDFKIKFVDNFEDFKIKIK